MNRTTFPHMPDDGTPIVFVVDDEAPVRDSLASLFRSVGIRVETYASAPEFLRRPDPNGPCCLLLDVRLDGSNGLEVQRQLTESRINLPVIFMSGHGDISTSVKAMKAGALDFLVKPFRDQDLLDAVSAAHTADARRRQAYKIDAGVYACYQSLTPREREVMALATKGLMNKQIAAELKLSEITVKIHRGNAMKKMKAKSFADLVRMAESLSIGDKA